MHTKGKTRCVKLERQQSCAQIYTTMAEWDDEGGQCKKIRNRAFAKKTKKLHPKKNAQASETTQITLMCDLLAIELQWVQVTNKRE